MEPTILRMVFDTDFDGDVPLLLVSSTLYDLNLLHDLVALTVLPEYREYKFSDYFWYRNGRPLLPQHQLRAVEIGLHSPLEVFLDITRQVAEVVMPIIFSGVVIQQQFAKRDLLREKARRAKHDANIAKHKAALSRMKKLEFERRLDHKNAQIYDSIVSRLSGDLPIIDAELIDDDHETESEMKKSRPKKKAKSS